MALSTFTQTGGAQLNVGADSARVAIPSAGSPTIALVTNFGTAPVFVKLGDNTVVADQNGLCVMPGQTSLPLAIGSATHMAAIGGFGVSGLRIAVGTTA